MVRRYIFPVLIGVAGVAILIGLGVWQVQRLAWKEGILADIDARLVMAPVSLPDAPEATADKYLPVEIHGHAGPRELHVLVSHKRFGPGYRVVSAFVTDDRRRILLDLGFVRTEAADQPRAPLTGAVLGNLHWPDDRNSSTPENDVAGNIWFARDIDQMAAALGTEETLVVLRRADGLDATVTPLPLDTAAIPNDHLQYAITWFSLAVVWLGMTLFWLWRIKRREF